MHRSRFASALLGLGLFFSPLSLLVAARAASPPPNNLVYQIFVRSFADGDGDAHHIGDLKGITQHLDSYLNDGKPNSGKTLHVGALWLMPIFPSMSYHGYDISDYRAINPEYGTMDDFRALVAAAHARGVRILLDIAFNHTSSDHPWFKEAIANPQSHKRGWYHIVPDDPANPKIRDGMWRAITSPSGEKLKYLGLFSGRMPDLNFDSPEVREELKAITKYWLDLGVDGFRLDAAKHIYGDTFGQVSDEDIKRNNQWWQEWTKFVNGINPRALVAGEVLDSRTMMERHAAGLNGLLDISYAYAARDQAANPKAGFLASAKEYYASSDATHRAAFGENSPAFHYYPHLASHDQNPRLASNLEARKRRLGEYGAGMAASVPEAYRLAMSMLLTEPGCPILYQGDEVMQRGWKWNGNPPDAPNHPGDGSHLYDETLREPLPWYASGTGAEQTAWFQPRCDWPNDGVSTEEQDRPGGMVEFVRGLTRLRSEQPALATGSYGAIVADTDQFMAAERVSGEERLLVIVNLTTQAKRFEFEATEGETHRRRKVIYWNSGATGLSQDLTSADKFVEGSVLVPACGMMILKVVE